MQQYIFLFKHIMRYLQEYIKMYIKSENRYHCKIIFLFHIINISHSINKNHYYITYKAINLIYNLYRHIIIQLNYSSCILLFNLYSWKLYTIDSSFRFRMKCNCINNFYRHYLSENNHLSIFYIDLPNQNNLHNNLLCSFNIDNSLNDIRLCKQ